MDRSQSNRDRQSTHARYKRVLERFTGFLGDAKAKRDLATLRESDVARFRDHEAKELSRSTANLAVKVLRVVSVKQSGESCSRLVRLRV